jgi:hypothetical protein
MFGFVDSVHTSRLLRINNTHTLALSRPCNDSGRYADTTLEQYF